LDFQYRLHQQPRLDLEWDGAEVRNGRIDLLVREQQDLLQSDGQRSPDLDDRASVAPEGGSGRTRSDPPDSPDSPLSRPPAGLEAVLIAAPGAAMSLNNIVPFAVGHFAVDVPHLVAGALLVVVFTGAVLRRRALPDRRLTLFAAGLAAVPLAGLLFPHLPGFSAG